MVFEHKIISVEKTTSWNKISMKPERVHTIPDNFFEINFDFFDPWFSSKKNLFLLLKTTYPAAGRKNSVFFTDPLIHSKFLDQLVDQHEKNSVGSAVDQ